MVGQRMGREQVGLEGWRHERSAMVGRLHPQEPAGLPQIDEIDGGPEPSRQSTAHVEEGHGVEGPDAEHRQIEVAANAGLTSGLAAVQPGSQHPLTGERGGEFGQQRFSELFNRDHGTRSYRLPPRAARAAARDGGPSSVAGGTVKKVPDSFIAGLFAGKGLGGMAGSRYRSLPCQASPKLQPQGFSATTFPSRIT